MKKSLALATGMFMVLSASAPADSIHPAFTCWLTGETLTANVLQTVVGNGDSLDEATRNGMASCRYFFLKNCRIDRCNRN